MTMTTKLRVMLVATLVVFSGYCFVLPTNARAQNYQGYNAVWGFPGPGSTACKGVGPGSAIACQSSAFIDASVFGGDFCAQVEAALAEAQNTPDSLPAAVIDARGLASTSCLASDGNPWSGITIPSVLLLPAGTITLSAGWVLPSATTIIGEGVGMTTLNAAPGVTTVISMGSSSLCSSQCTGVGIQDLTLIQTNSPSIAIDNEYAGDQSYVRRVNIYVNTTNTVTGLQILAQNSGPYENITFYGSSNTSSPASAPACVKLLASGVKIHGLNCIGNVRFGAAVLLDGSNDSIEDVYVSNAFAEGVAVGAGGSNNVSNDVLLNITGGGTNSVRICPASGGTGACTGTNTVEDVSILGVAKGATTSNSIMDEVTPTTLADAAVSMYILGESVAVNSGVTGYARFTTSPSTATWGVGNMSPSGNCTSSTKGALFSNTAGDDTSSSAFWVCNGTNWVGVY
jgi:hypothetical protein